MNFIARTRERLTGRLRTSSQRDSAASDDLNDLVDVLDESRRAVWATVAAAARRCDGRLMGGTALAVHLRHRASMDFDVFTVEDFYHPHVIKVLRAGGHDYDSHMVRHNSVTVELDGVMVQIYKDTTGAGAAATRIADAHDVHGMPVGSLQDVFASKLNAVRGRSAERDLFDIWAVDTQTWCKIEDGIHLHRVRYGIDAQDEILNGLARLLDAHAAGTLDVGGVGFYPADIQQASEWLAERLPEVSEVVAMGRSGTAVPFQRPEGSDSAELAAIKESLAEAAATQSQVSGPVSGADPPDPEAIRRLRREGLSQKAIADRLKTSLYWVRKALKRR